MSDHEPRLDRPLPDDDATFQPRTPSRGLYLVVGVVAAVVAAAGLMFFSGDGIERNDLARNPDPAAIDARTNETRTPTIPRVTPVPATPAEPATPGPGRQP
jgi:hypothetical protein